jgi:glutamate dehydrogenase (NADP+)
VRTEATGYGCVYFAREMLARSGQCLEGRTCAISGSGNVAQYAAQKLLELGAKVVTMSDRTGFLHDPRGLSEKQLAHIIDLKTNQRATLREYAKSNGCKYYEGKKPWVVPCDAAFPCATQNEITEEDAHQLLKNGCTLVSEGANMPTYYTGVKLFEEAQINYAPGKAANAGGVAISGLEMTQNSIRLSWSREEVDNKLQEIMRRIHEQCVEYGTENGGVNYVKGANIAGFKKVADAMLAYGIV